MLLNNKYVQLCIALVCGLIVMLLPRPEGTKFEIVGDQDNILISQFKGDFVLDENNGPRLGGYVIKIINPEHQPTAADWLEKQIVQLELTGVSVNYVDGMSPKAKLFLAALAFLIFLFIFEPIPLEITAVCIGVLMIMTGVTDVKGAWAPYMHPVVVFIMCCLVFAIASSNGARQAFIKSSFSSL